MRTRRAEIGCGPVVLSIPTQQLNFDGIWEFLILPHTFERLPMHHDPTVPQCPTRPARALVTREPVFNPNHIIRERPIEKQMSKPPIKLVILLIRDLQQPVFHAEGVPEVLARRVAFYFGCPAGEILAVEELDPLAFVVRLLGGGRCRRKE